MCGALRKTRLIIPEVHHVNVRAQPDVVRQVPALVIRVLVNHDLVAVPQPSITESDVIGGDVEVESPEPEAVRPSATQMPDVAAAKSTGKAPVLPRVINVVVGVSWPAIVSNPFAVGVDVGRLGVPRRIGIMMLSSRGRGMSFSA